MRRAGNEKTITKNNAKTQTYVESYVTAATHQKNKRTKEQKIKRTKEQKNNDIIQKPKATRKKRATTVHTAASSTNQPP
jgi:hypothetical protein